MLQDLAIQIDQIGKKYKLYRRNVDRVREAVCPWATKRSIDFEALSQVSFNVKKGETLGIIGQNGSGKSTLLKIITGVIKETTGHLAVNGRISALLELGAGFHPDFTGIENIYLSGTIQGLSRQEVDQKLPEILGFADIGEHVNHPVKTYSSGMFVRLAFATAINVDPDIFIVDEALSVGDMFFQLKCYKKFEEFKQKGKTVLFVTHDMGSILKYCDRAIVLERGRVIGSGAPRDMIDLYKKSLVDHGARFGARGEGDARNSKTETGVWKSHFINNPHIDPYGNNYASIFDYGIFDHFGRPNAVLQKGEKSQVKMRISFLADISSPIFAFTIKDKKGNEICGTNTWIEKSDVGIARKNDVLEVVFEQNIELQGGSYLLSLGCTGFDQAGDFVVYQRLYDVIQFEVVSTKNTVGFFDMNSKITIHRSP